jgi:hypothetical protein
MPIITGRTPLKFADDVKVVFGSDNDNVLVHRSAVLTTNTPLTNVLEGTPVTPTLAANSFILSNTTLDGDMMFAISDGGNSTSFMWMDGSTDRLGLFTTENSAGYKVQIGETVSTSSLYGKVLLVNGGVGGNIVARFQREISGVVSNIDMRFGGGDATIIFSHANQSVNYTIGVDITDSAFKLERAGNLFTADKNIFEADLTTTTFNADYLDMDFIVSKYVASPTGIHRLIHANAGLARVGINTNTLATPTATLHVDQSNIAGAIPVLHLDQADTDKPFIKFVGAGATDDSKSFSDDTMTPTIRGYVRVDVDDVNDTIDGTYWVQLHSLA